MIGVFANLFVKIGGFSKKTFAFLEKFGIIPIGV